VKQEKAEAERSLKGIARSLRQRSTDAERVLWHHLRNRHLAGAKFRRQHPIGRFVVDFLCLELGLIVELDGGQHLDSEADKQRDDWLNKEGYRVLRFWNNEVLKNTNAVLERVMLEIEDIGNAGETE